MVEAMRETLIALDEGRVSWRKKRRIIDNTQSNEVRSSPMLSKNSWSQERWRRSELRWNRRFKLESILLDFSLLLRMLPFGWVYLSPKKPLYLMTAYNDKHKFKASCINLSTSRSLDFKAAFIILSVTIAPSSNNNRTIAILPCVEAASKGVAISLSCALTSAPFSNSNLAICSWPYLEAICNEVPCWYSLSALTFSPFLSNSSTTFLLFRSEAKFSATSKLIIWKFLFVAFS